MIGHPIDGKMNFLEANPSTAATLPVSTLNIIGRQSLVLSQMNGCLAMTVTCYARDYGEKSIDLWFSEDLEKGLHGRSKRFSLQNAPVSLDWSFVSSVIVQTTTGYLSGRAGYHF